MWILLIQNQAYAIETRPVKIKKKCSLFKNSFIIYSLPPSLWTRDSRSFWDAPERDSIVDCLVHAVVPYFLVLWIAEGKSTNIFPNGQIIYAINVPRSESKNRPTNHFVPFFLKSDQKPHNLLILYNLSSKIFS